MKAGWRTATLGDVCHVYQPETLAQKSLRSGPYPVFGANGEIGFHDEYNHEDPQLVLGCRGSCGTVHVTPPKSWINGNAMVVVPSEQVHRDFLAYALLGGIDIAAAITGAAQPQITRKSLTPIEIPLPPLPEQRRIVALLDEAFEGIAMARANAEKNIENARVVFESHLDEVFSGNDSGWGIHQIEEHVRFIDYRGRTPEKTPSGLRLITARNVKMGFVQEEPAEYVAPDSYDAWMTRGIPKKGDVLFTTEAPLANVAQLDTDERVVFAQRVIIMQAEPRHLDSTFLKYALLSPPVQGRIREKATGATALGIKASLLKKVLISYPASLVAQKAVAERCTSLEEQSDGLEAVVEQKLAALDELKKSLLYHAFAGEL